MNQPNIKDDALYPIISILYRSQPISPTTIIITHKSHIIYIPYHKPTKNKSIHNPLQSEYYEAELTDNKIMTLGAEQSNIEDATSYQLQSTSPTITIIAYLIIQHITHILYIQYIQQNQRNIHHVQHSSHQTISILPTLSIIILYCIIYYFILNFIFCFWYNNNFCFWFIFIFVFPFIIITDFSPLYCSIFIFIYIYIFIYLYLSPW